MLVTTKQDLEKVNEFIEANDILAYDTETTGLNVRKDSVIGFAISNETTGFYIPILSYDANSGNLLHTGIAREDILNILNKLATKKLLMFNASFDARITRNNLGVNLLPSLHTDVLLLKHTCDEEFPFGLKEIATKLWGSNEKAEKEEMQASVKANGGTATEYYKADVSVLSKYAIQDCLLTYRIYNYYRPILRKEGLDDFYYKDEVLPLYKTVTIPMEDKGVHLNVPVIKETLAEINRVLADLERGIQEAMLPHLEAVFVPWFLNKDYPLQTWKGNVTLLGRRFRDSGSTDALAFQKEAWARDNQGYMFNLQSKHHLKKLFFDTLKEEPLSRTEKGNPQVDEEFLEAMAAKHAWCAKLIEYNKLQKIKGTYIERFLEEEENGIYYPSFMQHRTVSGRYAGDMQQLPRPLEQRPNGEIQIPESVIYFTNRIREFIVSAPGHVLISADYEQLEPSIFAHTSGDPALQEIFYANTDFYSTVAIKTERKTEHSAIKTAPNYLGRVDKAARQRAKAYSLGIAYGMTAYKLKFELNCSEEEASKLVNDYYKAFPKLKEWMDESRSAVRKCGYIKTQTGRVRHLYRAKTIYEKYGSPIENDLDLWKLYHNVPSVYSKVKADRKEYKNLMNNAINFQVQGLAASIVNRAAIALANLGMVPVLQVHDELVYHVPQNEAEQACATIKQIMESIVKLTVPLRTVPQIGTNYRQTK